MLGFVGIGNSSSFTNETVFCIPKEDFLKLLEYYKYIKENDIQDDFINPNGKNWYCH